MDSESALTSSALSEAEQALAAADEAMGTFSIDAVVAHLSTAIRGFTAAGRPCAAAIASARLGQVYGDLLGNLTAARALYARAQRLVADEPECIEQGWVAVAAMGCDVDDPDLLLAAAELALARARRFGDVNLEAKALADAGLAHVRAGRIATGMELLDEAMALVCGPACDGDVAARSVCSFFTACQCAADFARASNWAGPLQRHGLIGSSGPGPAFLSGHCDSVQATLLLELGRWGEAEALIQRAHAAFEAIVPGAAWHPALALADLRIRQHRFDEAEALLLAKDQTLDGLLLAARMHSTRGDLTLARATIARGSQLLGSDRLRGVELLALVVDVELASGNLKAAQSAVEELEARASGLDIAAIVARVATARARILAVRGDVVAALAELEPALQRLDPREVPWSRLLLLIERGRLRGRAGLDEEAWIDARAARVLLGTLDAQPPPDDVAWLDAMDRAKTTPARAADARLSRGRDGKWWTAEHGGAIVRLPDSKGLRYLAELLGSPDVERHALDLVDRIEGVDPNDVPRRALGGGLPASDAHARREYRQRIESLRADVEEALALGNDEAAESAQAEIDGLVTELARSFGLGQGLRTTGSPAEKARLNVTRALRAAIARLTEALPEAGRALGRRIRTGLYCAYLPTGAGEIRWMFGPD